MICLKLKSTLLLFTHGAGTWVDHSNFGILHVAILSFLSRIRGDLELGDCWCVFKKYIYIYVHIYGRVMIPISFICCLYILHICVAVPCIYALLICVYMLYGGNSTSRKPSISSPFFSSK